MKYRFANPEYQKSALSGRIPSGIHDLDARQIMLADKLQALLEKTKGEGERKTSGLEGLLPKSLK